MTWTCTYCGARWGSQVRPRGTRCAALELTGEARTYCDGEGAPGTKRARARDRAQGVLDFGTGIGVEAETGKAIPDGDGRAREGNGGGEWFGSLVEVGSR